MTHKIPWLPDCITGERKILSYKGKINSECKNSIQRRSALGNIEQIEQILDFFFAE